VAGTPFHGVCFSYGQAQPFDTDGSPGPTQVASERHPRRKALESQRSAPGNLRTNHRRREWLRVAPAGRSFVGDLRSAAGTQLARTVAPAFAKATAGRSVLGLRSPVNERERGPKIIPWLVRVTIHQTDVASGPVHRSLGGGGSARSAESAVRPARRRTAQPDARSTNPHPSPSEVNARLRATSARTHFDNHMLGGLRRSLVSGSRACGTVKNPWFSKGWGPARQIHRSNSPTNSAEDPKIEDLTPQRTARLKIGVFRRIGGYIARSSLRSAPVNPLRGSSTSFRPFG